MKTFLILLVILALQSTLNINNCMSQWVQTSGPVGGNVYALAVSNNNPDTSGQVIFAGTYNGVYLSTNYGQNWTQAGLNNQIVRVLAVSGNNIVAGTSYNGVYLSTNKGQTWTQTDLNNESIASLAVSGNYVFAGLYNYGVYLSPNYGQNWIPTSLYYPHYVNSLAAKGNNVFAGTGYFNTGIFLSTNYGQTWSQTTMNYRDFYSLAISGNNVFAGAGINGSGVFLSTNNGQSWTQTGLIGQLVWSFAVSSNNPDTSGQVIFAGTNDNGVYLSTNNGQNWINRNEGFNAVPPIRTLIIAGNYIFAGTEGLSVWRRGLSEITGIQNISAEIPAAFSLKQNYPNPFNPTTKIRFALPKQGFVTLKVFDALGREIETLVNENLQPGTYESDWNAAKYASGVYFYRIQTFGYSEVKKMLLVK